MFLILVCQVQRNPLYLGIGTQEIRASRAWSAWWSHDIFVSALRICLSRHATIFGNLNKAIKLNLDNYAKQCDSMFTRAAIVHLVHYHNPLQRV